MCRPLAYLLTWHTYGTWLHGDPRQSVDAHHNVPGTAPLPPDPSREARARSRMTHPPLHLTAAARQVVLDTLRQHSADRDWSLHAAHVFHNHVHVVVTAPLRPEQVMGQFKAWASRRPREHHGLDKDRPIWPHHGSTRWLWSEDAVAERIDYVLRRQGEPMARWPEPDRSDTCD
jgi:REP element-mobilizing transposase RayT